MGFERKDSTRSFERRGPDAISGVARILTFALAAFFSVPQAQAFTLVGSSALEGWRTDLLEIHLNPDRCPLPEADLNQAIDQAIDLWNSVPTSSIRLHRGINVATTPAQALAGDGTSGILTPSIICDPDLGTTQTPNIDDDPIPAVTGNKADGLILNYAYILLNADPGARSNIAKLPTGKFAMVLAHEIGHVLGLGHTSDPRNLMYFDVTARTELSLSQDDIDGVTYLYPRHELVGSGLLGCGSIASEESRTGGLPRLRGSKLRGLGMPPGAGEVLGLFVWAFGVVHLVRRKSGLRS